MTTEQAARLLLVCPKTIERLARRGVIAARKIAESRIKGGFRRYEIDEPLVINDLDTGVQTATLRGNPTMKELDEIRRFDLDIAALYSALLDDAIACARGIVTTNCRTSRKPHELAKLRREARHWFASADIGPISLSDVCDFLRLDLRAVQRCGLSLVSPARNSPQIISPSDEIAAATALPSHPQ